MWRQIGGVVAGIAVWIVVAWLLGLSTGFDGQDYAPLDFGVTFDLRMMIAGLSEVAVCSLISGYLAALVSLGRSAPLITGTIISLLFVPFHLSTWNLDPVWYHLTFLISLPLLSYLGGKLWSAKPMTA